MAPASARMDLSSPRQTSTVVAVVVLLETAIFLVDIRMQAGLIEWLAYLLPVMLCLLAPTAWLPLATAVVSTVLLALGLRLGPPGPLDDLGRTNREIGLTVLETDGVGAVLHAKRLHRR